MSDAYDLLTGSLRERGIDVPAAERALASLVVETPSWGYRDSGTRFRVFRQTGRPRDVRERIDDAAEVHRLTGTAGAVALHFPWDAADDYDELRAYIEGAGLRVGAVNPNLFQDPDYRLGSIAHPDPRVREKAVRHLRKCLEIRHGARRDRRVALAGRRHQLPGRGRPAGAAPPAHGEPRPGERGPAARAGAAGRVPALEAASTRPISRTGARPSSSVSGSATARASSWTSATTRRA